MEEIKQNILLYFDNHFNNSEEYLQKHNVHNQSSVSCGEDVKNKLKIYLDLIIDAHKKELNSGRRMYQRGREDMGRELIEEIEGVVMSERLFIRQPFIQGREYNSAIKDVINIIKNHDK